MKRYLLITALSAALLATAACDKDGTSPEASSAAVELRLTGSLQVQSKATHGLDTYLAADQEVHVWVDDAGTGDALYENNVLTVQSDNTTLSGDPMYFPNSRNAVDIYAIHGNFGEQDLSASFWDTEITHTVSQDQQSAGSGYALSDLVYDKMVYVERTYETVDLEFIHLLSKVEIVLKDGNGSPGISKAEILNTRLQADFTPVKRSYILSVGGTANDFSVTAAGEAAENPIVIDNDITAADATDVILNEAIIVPQTLSSGTTFIRLTTGDGSYLYYTLPSDATFEAGKKYRYTITANLTDLSVSIYEVGDWTDSGTVNKVTSEMESIYKSDLSTAKVGDLITKAGQLIDVDNLDKLTDADKEQVVGVVFWTPNVEETLADDRTTPASLTDDKIMAADYPNCTHGLAVAVNKLTYDDSETMFWQYNLNPYYGFNVGNWQSNYFTPDSKYNASDFVSIRSGSDATDAVNYIYGYQNTIVFRAFNEYYEYSTDYIIRPVVALDDLEESCPAPANSTGWFFPSVKEMHMLFYKDVDDVCSSEGGTDTRDKVNISLAYVGDQLQTETSYYWASTELDARFSIYAYFIFWHGTIGASTLRKDSVLTARAVCAF